MLGGSMWKLSCCKIMEWINWQPYTSHGRGFSCSPYPQMTFLNQTVAQVDNLPEIVAGALCEGYAEWTASSAAYAPDSCKVKSYFVLRGIRVRFQVHKQGNDEQEVMVSSSKFPHELGITSFQNLFHDLGFDVEAYGWLILMIPVCKFGNLILSPNVVDHRNLKRILKNSVVIQRTIKVSWVIQCICLQVWAIFEVD